MTDDQIDFYNAAMKYVLDDGETHENWRAVEELALKIQYSDPAAKARYDAAVQAIKDASAAEARAASLLSELPDRLQRAAQKEALYK